MDGQEVMIIEILGEPIAWKRPADKSWKGKHWRFDSQKPEKEKVRSQFMIAAHQLALKSDRFDDRETHEVNLYFYLPLNQSDPTGQKNAKLWGLQPCNEKPDCDNLAKFYLDCGNGILWSDDKRISTLRIKKFYSQNPRTLIEIMTKNNLSMPPSIEAVLRVFGPQKLKEFADHVKALSYLNREKIEESVEEMDSGSRERWLAYTALLLSKLAQSHANDFKTIMKYQDVESEYKQLNIGVKP